MSRPSSDQSYRPRTLVPTRTLRKRTDAPSTAARVRSVVAVLAAVALVVAVASFPLAAVAVASAYAAVRAVRTVAGRRARQFGGDATFRVPGVAVEVTLTRTDGE